jgi:hypothetical protein
VGSLREDRCLARTGTTVVVATGVLGALDTDDSVDTVAATLGVVSEVFAAGVLTTPWLAATVPLSVAEEEADESAVTPRRRR